MVTLGTGVPILTLRTRYNQTPLYWAENRGYEGTANLLLEREDSNPNTADTGLGRTLLVQAASGGHRGVVKLLLKREDLNPDIQGFPPILFP